MKLEVDAEELRGRIEHIVRRGEVYGSGRVQVEDSERVEFSRTADSLYVRAPCHLSTVLQRQQSEGLPEGHS